MYKDNQGAYTHDSADNKRETMLSALHNRFQNLNIAQFQMINQIADRVHEILNKRVPAKEQKAQEPVPAADYAQRIEKELNQLEQNNNSLDQILMHLNEIV